jgi:hypothetical protein
MYATRVYSGVRKCGKTVFPPINYSVITFHYICKATRGAKSEIR